MKKNTTAVVAIMIALIALVGTGLGFAFTAAMLAQAGSVITEAKKLSSMAMMTPGSARWISSIASGTRDPGTGGATLTAPSTSRISTLMGLARTVPLSPRA